MSKAKLGTRIVLGLLFVVFGLNGFLQFLPIPPPTPAGGEFLGALFKTGYMFPVIKGIEVIAGLLLLSGFFVPLALLLLAPIVVNIFLYHTILDLGGFGLAFVILVLTLVNAWFYRDSYKEVLKMK